MRMRRELTLPSLNLCSYDNTTKRGAFSGSSGSYLFVNAVVLKDGYERTLYELIDGDVGELLHLFNDELLLVDLAHLSYYSVTSRTPIRRG